MKWNASAVGPDVVAAGQDGERPADVSPWRRHADGADVAVRPPAGSAAADGVAQNTGVPSSPSAVPLIAITR